ncbi:MAG: 2-succinyl-5-enolpyruvyl-6-hydroxy-3-cyclohexene-1-carboxylic-acid synthase [Prevotella sp.]|nr:2-succinyl-5-enolpyruvyl-6-hydroxy-3-cyclohexene-1-carboxylic-acid synthase [Prevotella sp.]
MYSNKEHVNILTSLLVAHGIRHAVVCPGSRNSSIVHNLNECPDIACYPVTDERSAGFYALGMTQALQQPVAVCVTSGTALLNLAPAVAEAWYQHRPLVVISADRPPQWIDQLDGQTLPQPDALGRFVRKAVSLPEIRDDEQRWYCNRLVNEALIVRNAPVHINVPISEPLFDYTVSDLPVERRIEWLPADIAPSTLSHVARMFLQAQRPMLISGQPMNPLLDEAVSLVAGDDSYVPDFVLCIGDSIVSKRLKRFLRKARETWVVNETGEVTDTFMNLTHVVQGDGEAVADHIRMMLVMEPHPFVKRWDDLLEHVRRQVGAYEPAYSEMAAVKYFESQVGYAVVHYANSSAIRLANSFAGAHPVFCNRGVNGIEGSLSTAAGFSVVSDERVFCVIGDLSFFYDQNALWNRNLRGNFRILLLNNGCGGIFNMLSGLEQSAARDRLVAAGHHTSAEGICRQNDVVYLSVNHAAQLPSAIDTLLYLESDRPVLLEVFTDPDDDARVLRDYYQALSL